MTEPQTYITRMVTSIGGRRPPHLYIKEWMDHRGLSDEKVAGRLEIDRATVWKWRTDQGRLTTEKMAALAAVLDIEPQDLYRLPSRPSIDAMIQDQPDELQQMVADVVRRMVGRGN